MDSQTSAALLAALVGALVGGGASLGTALWSLSRTRRDNLALSGAQHRLARRAAMARISIWADLAAGRLTVLNNSGEPISGLRVDATLLRAPDIDSTTIEGREQIDVGYVPPAGDAITRPLPPGWLFPEEYARGDAFCILESQFQDAFGDSWEVGASGQVTLRQTAEELDAELLAIAEAGGFVGDETES